MDSASSRWEPVADFCEHAMKFGLSCNARDSWTRWTTINF